MADDKLCTCLSISRDPLCVFHGTEDLTVPLYTRPPEPERWFITFGQGHALANYYMELHGNFEETRKRVMQMFGQKWSMQYTSHQWEICKKTNVSGEPLERIKLPWSLTNESERQSS